MWYSSLVFQLLTLSLVFKFLKTNQILDILLEIIKPQQKKRKKKGDRMRKKNVAANNNISSVTNPTTDPRVGFPHIC